MTVVDVLSFLVTVISIYMIIITFRIFFSWFSGMDRNNQLLNILRKITDPYLFLFRRIKFLKIGMFDLSPILGILLLYFVQILLSQFQIAILYNESITSSSALSPLNFGSCKTNLTSFPNSFAAK